MAAHEIPKKFKQWIKKTLTKLFHTDQREDMKEKKQQCLKIQQVMLN